MSASAEAVAADPAVAVVVAAGAAAEEDAEDAAV